MAKSRLNQLSELGQSVWIDYLSRAPDSQRGARADDGGGRRRRRHLEPDDLPEGDRGGRRLRRAAARGAREEDDPKEVFLRLAIKDVQDACDLLRPVWDGGAGQDGYVSIEVDPNLAYDTEGTIAEAQRLHEPVDRPNCFVKIPATEPGLPAIEEMIARRPQHQRDADLLARALRRGRRGFPARARAARRKRRRPGPVASVASFFVSRVDTEADKRLEELGAPDELKGKLAIANAKLAYQRYEELHSGERWEALAAKGARTQRCLWASTSTKNPAYRDVMYVEELIGPATVDTMPEETIRAFQDHGEVALTLERDIDEARRVFERIAEAGVDYDDVVAVLEKEGVDKFSDSFKELLEGVRAKRGELVSA